MASSLRKPLPIELITLAYILLTGLLILLFRHEMDNLRQLLIGRLMILVGMGLLYLFYRLRPGGGTLLLRYIFPLTLLSYWYPDTYEFCKLFDNRDYIFARADEALFGCQPSLSFSEWLPQKFWSELFHLGYFAYYPMILLTAIVPLFTERRLFERTSFVILTCFFFYYLIYLFLPVTGPQYYFYAVGEDLIRAGRYPELGDYFRYHAELAPSPGPPGFFRELVEATQTSGERPTAAFPSSHVGMSTILLFLLYRNRHWLCYAVAPFYLILCGATVYIQAHYLIDVFAGWVTAIVFYPFSNYLWDCFSHHTDRVLIFSDSRPHK